MLLEFLKDTFAFDYLRDNLVKRKDQKVFRLGIARHTVCRKLYFELRTGNVLWNV